MSITTLRLTEGKRWSADSVESLFETKRVAFQSALNTIAANSTVSYTPDITQPGWIPTALIRAQPANLTDGSGDSNAVLRGFYLNVENNSVYASVKNVGSSQIKVHVLVEVLYIKPRFPLNEEET